MTPSELTIAIMPDQTLNPEWCQTAAKLNQNTEVMQDEIFKRFQIRPEFGLLFLGFCDPSVSLSPSLEYFRNFAGLFIKKLTRTPEIEALRENVQIPIEEEELDQAFDRLPIMTGAEYATTEMLQNVWEMVETGYKHAIGAYSGTVAAFIKSYRPEIHLVGRVFFHLVESKGQEAPFAFLATYTAGLNSQGKSTHLPLQHALKQYGKKTDKMLALLSTVKLAAEKSELVAELIETGELFHPLAWDENDTYVFLKEVPVYEECGILCRIPNWWKTKSGPRLDVRIGDTPPSLVGMDGLLGFNVQILLGDLEISPDEAKKILEESSGLAFIKNKWVAVDHEKLKQTLEAYEKARELMKRGFSISEALRMQLHPEMLLDGAAQNVDIGISNGTWFKTVLEKLRQPENVTEIMPGNAFKANLRPYQQRGLNWLTFLHSLGFGGCLADDMGLGKTVQLLGFLSVIAAERPRKANLLIIPASLIGNWLNEIETFFPSMPYLIVHPGFQPDKRITPQSSTQLDTKDLVITTYALIQKYEWLQNHTWKYIILDEAQAIKNPGTKQTRTVKKIKALNRITLTGTPVENRLSDVWSLFDFLNPGLLGNKTEFGKFSKRLRENPEGYTHLRRLIKPYILRRLKTDKTVIDDLPEKVEMKTYTNLSKKQIVLYKRMVQELEKLIYNNDGIQRKGVILASLTKFKQLCNHPDQFLGTGNFLEKESGKFSRIREICETIYEKREKVLIFTQFKEIIEPLSFFLETIFHAPGLMLHGSVPVAKRKSIIAAFQSDKNKPYMVLSLKAGGVGLNLTQANHVIHFDRWWNPAIENQATDRAFRIGQRKNVIVHKFITKGTIEEKIDAMLENKKELSEKVVANSNENWITEMDNTELMDLFKLTL